MSSYYDEFINPFVPAKNAFVIRVEHLGRYIFAKNFLQQRTAGIVYDVGCGDGYGSMMLAEAAKAVVGVDGNNEFLTAAKKYSAKNILYLACDLEKESLAGKTQNLPQPHAIVCFETLEHVDTGEKLIKEFYQLLPHEGYLILSTPNALLEPKKKGISKNIFHKKMYGKEELLHLLEKQGFSIENVLGQAKANILYHKYRPLMRILNTLTQYVFFLLYVFTVFFAVPTKENIEKSYSMIFIAKKP